MPDRTAVETELQHDSDRVVAHIRSEGVSAAGLLVRTDHEPRTAITQHRAGIHIAATARRRTLMP